MLRSLLLLFLAVALLACGPATPAPSTSAAPAAAPTPERVIIDVNPLDDPTPLSSMIRVASPAPNATVGSPLQITGQAVGFWFNEATFPVALLDADRNVITQTYARAEGAWMTRNFVPFSAEVKFTAAAGTPATLLLELDNPSDTEGRRRAVEVPVVLR